VADNHRVIVAGGDFRTEFFAVAHFKIRQCFKK
jgi:hypothetical protein